MTQSRFQSEQMANEWATRICDRLCEIHLPPDEIEETRNIIYIFTKTAVEELDKDQKILLPYTDQPFEVQTAEVHEIIELFLRGVNYSAKKLRESGLSWDERKRLLEDLAWKLFNLSKLLVGCLHIPNPAFQSLLGSSRDLQALMKQSADILVQESLTGQKGVPLNFNALFKKH